MASSVSKTNELMQQFTNEFINAADYESLRLLLLGRQPLPEVLTQMEQHFSKLSARALLGVIDQLKQEACLDQIRQDQEEGDRDQQEAAQDIILKAESQSEFDTLHKELPTIAKESESLQLEVDKAFSRLSELKDNLQYDRFELKRIQRLNQNNPLLPSKAVQEHLYPQLPADRNKESEFVARVENLPLEIEQAQEQYDTLREQLTTLLNAQEEKKARARVLQQQLTHQLPNKLQARFTRTQERAQRATARNAENLDLTQQLSQQNRELLNQHILTAENESRASQQKQMEQVKEKSYSIFLEQLESVVRDLEISEGHQAALGYILADMKEYMSLETAEMELLQPLSEERARRAELQTQLHQFEQQLTDSSTSIPRLLKERAACIDKDKILRENSVEALETKDNYSWAGFYAGLGTFFAYFLTALITNTIILAPLLWLVPVIPAALALVFIICALTYYGDQCLIEEKIVANELAIDTLTDSISQQNDRACELNDTSIPALRLQLNSLDVALEPMERELREHQELMAFKMRRAEQVGSVYTGLNDHSFFANTTGANTDSPQPFAPAEDDADEYGPSFGGAAPGGASF